MFTGVLSIPLLLAKLWTVLPRFFRFPPAASVAHALERLTLLPLVGGSLFLLVTGLNNIVAWYPWSFAFVPAHYWAAWITIGALVIHIGAKATTTRHALTHPTPSETGSRSVPPASETGSRSVPPPPGTGSRSVPPAGLSRRGFVGVVGRHRRGPGRVGRVAVHRPRSSPSGCCRHVTSTWVRRASRSTRRPPFAGSSTPPPRPTTDCGSPATWRSSWSCPSTTCGPSTSTMPSYRSPASRDGASRRAGVGSACVDLLAMAGAPTNGHLHRRVAPGIRRLPQLVRQPAPRRRPRHAARARAQRSRCCTSTTAIPLRLIGPNRPGVNQTKWVREVRVV